MWVSPGPAEPWDAPQSAAGQEGPDAMSASAPVRQDGRVTEGERAPRRRGRAVAGGVLLLVGALLLPLSLAATWARAELAETDSYVATVAPLAGNAAVQDAVVDDVTNGVMAHVRLDGLLRAVPRAERPALRKHFTRGIREFVDKQVRRCGTGCTGPPTGPWTAV